jgi:hypothetical protein
MVRTGIGRWRPMPAQRAATTLGAVTMSGGDEALFDAATDRMIRQLDLLDELAAGHASAADPNVGDVDVGEPQDPWLVRGLESHNVAEWQAVLCQIVPNQVYDKDRVGPHEPLYIDATPSQEDYAAAAVRWQQAGFTPAEAKAWSEALDIHDDWREGAERAEEWRSRGFTPDEAWHWLQGDVPPADDAEHSRIFRDAGWHFFSVWSLYCLLDRESESWSTRAEFARLPTLHALNCARAGLTAHEAESLLGWESAELETHLAELFQTRSRIDPFIAMHFNHQQWQANCSEDDDTAWPFYARRLWDLHDEDDDEARRKRRQSPYGGPHVKKPHWKVLEERTERERREATPSWRPEPCPGSGGVGTLKFRDGSEDWQVRCPECGVRWAGGSSSPLPAHDRRRG